MSFAYFLKMTFPMMAFNVKKLKNGVHKNPGIHSSYYFYDFSIRNDNLGLEMKILKILGIQPRAIGTDLNFLDRQKSKNLYFGKVFLLLNHIKKCLLTDVNTVNKILRIP